MKNLIVFFILFTSILFSGISPAYGPGEEWEITTSTNQGFIIIRDTDNDGASLYINGVPTQGGYMDGIDELCPNNDCDILGAIYNGVCVGWSYVPFTNNSVTLVVQLNDGNTTGLENYPNPAPGFAEPIVTFNLFDASEGKMFYNIAQSTVVSMQSVFLNDLDVIGDGDFQSSDGFLILPPTVYPLGQSVCNLISNDEGLPHINFEAFGGGGDPSLCGVIGCEDSLAFNYEPSAIQDEDPSLCEYSGCIVEEDQFGFIANNFDSTALHSDNTCVFEGCIDLTAGNTVINGVEYLGDLLDCAGNVAHDYTTDTTSYDYAYHCCEYFGCIDPLATNYLDLETEKDCSGITDGNDTSCCTYAPTDINLTLNILQEEFNSNTYPTKFVELNWNHPQTTYCDQDESSPWYYEICFGDQQCDFYDNTSAIYPFEWNDNISYSFKAYGGCVVGISGELYGTEIQGEFTSPERPIPEIPNIPIISDGSGEGYVRLSWNKPYGADYYYVKFVSNDSDSMMFIASENRMDILLDNNNDTLSGVFYPLKAGKTYRAEISSVNINSQNNEQSSEYSLPSNEIITLEFPDPLGSSYMELDTVIGNPYSIELEWQAAPSYGEYFQVWTYDILDLEQSIVIHTTTETSTLITGLNPQTEYNFMINASSGYGDIQGTQFNVSTIAGGDGPDWGFQVKVNHLGYGFIPVDDENNFFGFANQASNHYDNDLDIVEPPAATDFVKFYFVREDWEEEQIGWGSKYAQEIRSRQDSQYATENYDEQDLAIFKAQLVSNMPGFTTFQFDLIDLYNDAPVGLTHINYCPVYLKLMAFDDTKYYKIEDGTEFTIQINSSTEYDMELIVGNLVPSSITNFSGLSNDTHIDPANIRPSVELNWDSPDECISNSATSMICNSISSRYPPTGYILEFNDGTEPAYLTDDILNYIHPDIDYLSYETDYEFVLSGTNNSGKGTSSQISVRTSDNIPPIAEAGESLGYETPHDGDPSPSNVDVTLNGSGEDPDKLGLRFHWNQISGDTVDLTQTFSIFQPEVDFATFETTFQTGLAMGSDTLVYEFELTAIDTFPYGFNQENGYSIDKDTVTIKIYPETNTGPNASLDVPRSYDDDGVLEEAVGFICMVDDTIIYNFHDLNGQSEIIDSEEDCSYTDGDWILDSVNDFLNWNWEADDEIGPIWEVPHDGNPVTNFANIQLVNTSEDLEGDSIYTLWSRSTPAETFIDANGNGIFDFGEPFNDLNNNSIYDWSEAINLNTLSTRSTPGVDTVQIFVEDSYGYRDTAQMIILILEEPNEGPTVNIGNDTIVFKEPETDEHYTYSCDNPDKGCYPKVEDPDNDGDPYGWGVDDIEAEIIDTLSFLWHDGSQSIGASFDLIEGEHELELCVTDPYGAQSCHSKSVTVFPEPFPDKVDNFNSYQDQYYIELTWQASDLSTLSEEYEDYFNYEENVYLEIPKYETSLNAAKYQIYRDGAIIETVVVEEDSLNRQLKFRYIDSGLEPSTNYEYKIIPVNSHNGLGLPSETKILSTTSTPTVEIISPNGNEIWASSYYDVELDSVVIKAFPVEWMITSPQNIRKINIFVSHDNGINWIQAEKFYTQDIQQVCSFSDLSLDECENTSINSHYGNKMSCEAMGNNWIDSFDINNNTYSEDDVNSCYGQIINTYEYPESLSSQDYAVQLYTQDSSALSPSLIFLLDTEPNEIYNQGDSLNFNEVVFDNAYIKGEGIEINHNTLVKVVAYDRGNYFDIYDEVAPANWTSSISVIEDISDGSFTLSSNKVTRLFDVGWHLFGPPVKPYVPRMFDSFQEPHGFGDWAYDWIAFAQSGSFTNLFMQMGHGYYLNNTSGGNLTIYGDPVSTAEFFEYDIDDINSDNYSIADIKLKKGWNLISNTLVRPISKYNFEIIHLEDNSNYTFDQAVTYGFVQPSIYGYDDGFYTTNSIYPFEGYFWHAARGNMLLKIRPHSFDQLTKFFENENWELQLTAQIKGENYKDNIVIGLGEFAENGFKYGEDEFELPKSIGETPLDIFIEEDLIGQIDENGNIAETNYYISNIKKMIDKNQSQIWKINFSNNTEGSPLELNWSFEEIDNDIDIKLYFEGQIIDMRDKSHIILEFKQSGSMLLVVGQDPLSVGLGMPLKFDLGQAYPNPFNPITNFRVELSRDGLVEINIYNVAGQIIDEVKNEIMPAGYHQIRWDSSENPSGLYFLKVKQGDNMKTQKLLLIK